jgi:hypothetical protein
MLLARSTPPEFLPGFFRFNSMPYINNETFCHGVIGSMAYYTDDAMAGVPNQRAPDKPNESIRKMRKNVHQKFQNDFSEVTNPRTSVNTWRKGREEEAQGPYSLHGMEFPKG